MSCWRVRWSMQWTCCCITKEKASRGESGWITVAFCALTAGLACEVLAKAGFRFTPEQLRVELREERWLVRLPENRLGWFAASPEAQKRLAVERRVLRLLQERCNFLAPRILI